MNPGQHNDTGLAQFYQNSRGAGLTCMTCLSLVFLQDSDQHPVGNFPVGIPKNMRNTKEKKGDSV